MSDGRLPPLHSTEWDLYANPDLLTVEPPPSTGIARLAKPRQGIGKAPYLASLAGDTADALSTVAVLRTGGMESNPLLGQDLTRMLPIKAASTAAVLLLMRELAKEKPGLAKWILYGNAGVKGAVATHNARIAAEP